MKQIYAFLDPNACTGCLTCELACEARIPTSEAILNAMSQDSGTLKRIYIEPGWGKNSQIVPIPVFCHHCEDAPCMKVCPVGAITRNEDHDVVVLDEDECIGCRECMMACPFGALSLDSQGKMVKCDLCIERLERDQSPACVESCPMEILKFVDEEEFSEAAKQNHIEQVMESYRYGREKTS